MDHRNPCTPAPASSELFPPEALARLAAAIAIHDEVDLSAAAPAVIDLDFDAALLERCYWICHQLWRGADLDALARIARRLALSGRLADDDCRVLKDIRSRAKQLRFAYAALGAGHEYPPHLDRLTRFMGQAQDAAKAGRRPNAAVRGILLCFVLIRSRVVALEQEIGSFVAARPDDFKHNVLSEIAATRQVCGTSGITDKTFHQTRKTVSRLVAFYDTLTVLSPSDRHCRISRILSTINGLMGAAHDEMVERKLAKRRDYLTIERELPSPVAERLRSLVSAFQTAGSGGTAH